MDRETKILFGKLLGEIYRVQKYMPNNVCHVGDQTIYGLLNGMESVIDEEIEKIGFISADDQKNLEDILYKYYQDENLLEQFIGYYQIENDLKKHGISRDKAIRILKYLYADGRYTNVIDKMNSNGSPVECKKFNLDDYDI
ncbi:hypothetical protein [Thermoactinomyces sp. CICC 10521]|uniref:hypothetical protein n=1 Tax=Thermoactinomyces sp. CICC 10521 TaxID=2767426 RepID=UPI0018DDA10F|nr:hypothetical protein [Thermoactinomyces sp. CICC 10521]MBH8609109.1 hypothetical protein [Thermoactinomyces sp. CICC 10521]